MKKENTLIDSAKRFGSWFIDSICFLFLVFLHAMVLDTWLGVMPEGGSDWFVIYFFILYVLYHLVFESFFGKTPGKFLTKTKVVNKEGEKPSFQQLLKRNLSRLIPLDPFSFLFSKRGWHDMISETYVVFDKKEVGKSV